MCVGPHVFVPYPLRKFRITSSFSYWWLWHFSGLTSYHLLSADYVRVQLVHFFFFFLCFHDVSCHFSNCLYDLFYSSSFCLHVCIRFFFVRANLNHIYSTPNYEYLEPNLKTLWYPFALVKDRIFHNFTSELLQSEVNLTYFNTKQDKSTTSQGNTSWNCQNWNISKDTWLPLNYIIEVLNVSHKANNYPLHSPPKLNKYLKL